MVYLSERDVEDLPTMASEFGRDAAYWGERGDWGVALCKQKYPCDLDRANWDALVELLQDDANVSGEDWAEEYTGHWACGGLDWLLVKPGTAAYALAQQVNASLDAYPILDEDRFYRYEEESATSVWKDCYTPKERITWLRNNGQWEVSCLADLFAVVRGKWFPGYPTELLA